MDRKFFPLFVSLFLLLSACVPESGLPSVFVVTETPTWYPSLTPIRTHIPMLVPTDTPPPPTYTPVVIATPDIVNAFCQGGSSPWSCSCGDYTETRWQGDAETEIFSTNRSVQPDMCEVGLPQWKYELTLPDTWYCGARGYYENNISCANQSRETFDLRSIYSEIPAHIADQVIIIFSEGGYRSYQPVVGRENVLLREEKDVRSRPAIRMLSVKDGNTIILRYFLSTRIMFMCSKPNSIKWNICWKDTILILTRQSLRLISNFLRAPLFPCGLAIKEHLTIR